LKLKLRRRLKSENRPPQYKSPFSFGNWAFVLF
jgi:hypothetical protein